MSVFAGDNVLCRSRFARSCAADNGYIAVGAALFALPEVKQNNSAAAVLSEIVAAAVIKAGRSKWKSAYKSGKRKRSTGNLVYFLVLRIGGADMLIALFLEVSKYAQAQPTVFARDTTRVQRSRKSSSSFEITIIVVFHTPIVSLF